jgi:hypothetical protein
MSHQPPCIVRSIHSSPSSNLLNDHWWQHIPGDSAANHNEEYDLAMVLHLFKILVAAWAEGFSGCSYIPVLSTLEISFSSTVN